MARTFLSWLGSGRPSITTAIFTGGDLPAFPNATYSKLSVPKKPVRGV